MSNKAVFTASAPGSVMLLGEHAVLHGEQAVVCAVDKRMRVTLRSREDTQIHLYSDLGKWHGDLCSLTPVAPFQFVLTALHYFRQKLTVGFDIEIAADFSHQVGLGSSAAVTVATVLALRSFLGEGCSPLEIFQDALSVVHIVQGCGSGADVAASVMGGVVAYQWAPLLMKNLGHYPSIGLFYSGMKTPTPIVIREVAARFQHEPDRLSDIYRQIGQCSEAGIFAIEASDDRALGQVFNEQQKAMVALGVNNEALQHWIERLRKQSALYGVKISGSGLGDCIVAVGEKAFFDACDLSAYIAITITSQGMYDHSSTIC